MFIIDVHQHWMPEAHFEQIAKHLYPEETVSHDGKLWRIRRGDTELFTINQAMYTAVEERIMDMDTAGIDMVVLSTGLWQWWNNMELAPVINDELSDIQKRYPDRLIGLAHVPPLDPDAPGELERAVKRLGLRGLCLTTHCQGKYIDDPAYLPLYRKAAELQIPIFVHASPTPVEYSSIQVGDARVLGRVFDLSIAATRLTYSDILDQLPGLTFVIGHLGGSFFLVNNRMTGKDGFFRTASADYEARWQHVYFDSAPGLWAPAQLACGVEMLGNRQVLFGTDYPVMPRWMHVSKGNMDAVRMMPEEREQVMGRNAARLLGVSIP